MALDVREKDSIAGFLDAAYEHYGRCDVVINNAGVEAGAKTYHTIDEDDWDFVLDTNPKSAWLVSKLYTDRWWRTTKAAAISSWCRRSPTRGRLRASFHTPYQKAV